MLVIQRRKELAGSERAAEPGVPGIGRADDLCSVVIGAGEDALRRGGRDAPHLNLGRRLTRIQRELELSGRADEVDRRALLERRVRRADAGGADVDLRRAADELREP